MNFELGELHLQVRDALRGVVHTEIAPQAGARDAAGEVPADAMTMLAELGMLGVLIPESLGGSGLDWTALVVALEEIAYGDASLALIVAQHNAACCAHLLRAGSDAQRAAWLESMASGATLTAWAEVEGPTAATRDELTTASAVEGGGWSLAGAKSYVPAAGAAQLLLVVARVDGAPATLLVPSDTPGVAVGPALARMGLRASGTASIDMREVSLADAALVGAGPLGPRELDTVKAGLRTAVAAIAVGVGRRALEEAARYALGREQFGRPIARFQAIQDKLAVSAVDVDGARLMCLQAAALLDAGRRCDGAAAGAKLMATRAALRAADEGIQIHGGYGYTREYPVERLWRDAKTCSLIDGRPAIERDAVAAHAYESVLG